MAVAGFDGAAIAGALIIAGDWVPRGLVVLGAALLTLQALRRTVLGLMVVARGRPHAEPAGEDAALGLGGLVLIAAGLGAEGLRSIAAAASFVALDPRAADDTAALALAGGAAALPLVAAVLAYAIARPKGVTVLGVRADDAHVAAVDALAAVQDPRDPARAWLVTAGLGLTRVLALGIGAGRRARAARPALLTALREAPVSRRDALVRIAQAWTVAALALALTAAVAVRFAWDMPALRAQLGL